MTLWRLIYIPPSSRKDSNLSKLVGQKLYSKVHKVDGKSYDLKLHHNNVITCKSDWIEFFHCPMKWWLLSVFVVWRVGYAFAEG